MITKRETKLFTGLGLTFLASISLALYSFMPTNNWPLSPAEETARLAQERCLSEGRPDAFCWTVIDFDKHTQEWILQVRVAK